MTPERQKEGTLQALVAQMDGLSHEQPVLFIFEDVHWADPTSLELLGITIERTQDLPALVVITFRPEFTAPWTGYTHVTSLTLNRFTRSLVATMVNKVTTGKPLPDKVLAQIVEKTDGVPLFVEELTKTTLESGLLTEEADKYVLSGPLPEVAIPTTLHDSLLARLDRLGTVKEVAQTASAIGREFDHELLAALSPLSVDELHEALDQLINAGLIFPRGRSTKTIYSFKHALVQDAAYESLLRSTRQTLHGRIAETIRATFPDVVSAQPELLAHHFTEARRSSEAIEWWLRAGQQAAERSAIQETVAHLSRGLVVLGRLPQSTERDRRELAFQIALGGPLMTTRGWGAPDTAKTFKRARELCEQLGDTKELLPALYGEWIQTITGGDISAGQDAAIELLRLSEEQGDSAGIVNAHRCLCFCSLLSGNLASAGRYIEEGLKVYDPKEHRSLGYRFAHDPLVSLLSQRALIESLTGYGERALETCTEAIGYATELAHLPSRIFATWISGALPAAIRRDIESAERHSREILSLSKELNIPTWRAWGSVANGWALGRHGDPEAAVSLVREGLELQNRQGSLLLSTLLLHLAADLYLATEELGEVQLALDEAKNLVERNNERFWEAEILRLYGELYVVQNSMAKAGDAFNRAIEVARTQGAKALELRAATSLARLWHDQGKRVKPLRYSHPSTTGSPKASIPET